MGERIVRDFMSDPLGKIMLAVITALVVWVGQNTQGNSVQLAAMGSRLDAMEQQIDFVANPLAFRIERLEREVDRIKDGTQ